MVQAALHGTIAGRFRLLDRVGQGGMGQVFRAEDLESGRLVALKRMTSLDLAMAERFRLEAQTLASLSHPAIVGYVAHGITAEQEPYLAMAWLEGQDLARTLEGGRLGLRDAWQILRRIADALASAHASGVVHRDLKPANIMLVGGRPEGATLVDFGIARRDAIQHNITRTGAIIGTVGYMAPEQLQGHRDIDARADLFALGCVAFECLTGRPAFEGGNLGAVIGRLLFGETPRVRDLAPELPLGLDELVTSLLQADRERRPASAAEVAARLAEVEPNVALSGTATLLVAPARPRPTLAERVPSAMILVLPPAERETALDATLLATDDAGSGSGSESSSSRVDYAALQHACEATARRWGARLTAMADGVVLAFSEGSALQERVQQAGRAALEIQRRLPGWRVSLVLSRGDEGTRAGDTRASSTEHAPEETLTSGVIVDASAAAFLGDAFVVRGPLLVGFTPTRDEARKVLGRSAPCLGRDKELRLLEGTLDECADEEACRALILRSEAGVGKSRIRREFIGRVRDRGDAAVVLARCDVGSRAIHYGVLRAWFADHLGLDEVAPEARYAHLLGRLLPRLRATANESAELLLEYFAELAGVAVPEPSARLLDARANPREMRRGLQLALEAWIRATSASAPLVLVLEDLHWADPASISLLASTWPALEEVPLLLLVTTWPGVEDSHPALFELRHLQIVDVAPLGRRASERLARRLLDEGATATLIERVVELADGNAFLLEELLRHVGAGHSLESLPGSAVAIVQGRLAALAPEARRVLRVASVLGERFELAALEAIAGDDLGAPALEALLGKMAQAELLFSPGADEQGAAGRWAFRHSLVRRAAYELLTDEDRRNAHLAAGRWLAARPESDPAMVAEHFEEGGAWGEAVRWLGRALDAREETGDLEGVAELGRRLDRPDVEPTLRATAAFRRAMAEMFLGRHDIIGETITRFAAAEFDRGNAGWAAILVLVLGVKLHVGVPPQACPELADVGEALTLLERSDVAVFGVCMLFAGLLHNGLLDRARAVADQLVAMTSAADTPLYLVALRDGFIPWMTAMDCGPGGLAATRESVEIVRRRCGPMRKLEIYPAAVVYLIDHGCIDEARALAEELRQVCAAGGFAQPFWVPLIDVLLATSGPAPVDCRARVEGLVSEGWLHVIPRALAVAAASPSLAAPHDPAIAREAVAAIEPIVESCGAMLSARSVVLAYLAECAVNAGAMARAESASAEALREPVILMPAPRARAAYARVRALAALGRGDEARAEAERHRAWLTRYADALEADDRRAFLAAPEVAGALGFTA